MPVSTTTGHRLLDVRTRAGRLSLLMIVVALACGVYGLMDGNTQLVFEGLCVMGCAVGLVGRQSGTPACQAPQTRR